MTRGAGLFVAIACLAAFASGCGKGEEKPKLEEIKLDISWQDCTPGAQGRKVECATIQVPLDWNDPNGRRISYFVQRMPARQQPSRGAIWYLTGGPGFTESITYAEHLTSGDPTLDLYLPDHRGVGRSSRLGCPDQESLQSPGLLNITVSELDPCLEQLRAEWGDGVRKFSATGAAHDVGEVIRRTRKTDGPVFVYGLSYGTYLAQRYLQLYPHQATGVILNSAIYPPEIRVTAQSESRDRAIHKVFDQCGRDPFCSGKLGSDPWSRLGEALDKVERQECRFASPFSRDDLRMAVGAVGQGLDSTILPALVYRILRCSEGDRAALNPVIGEMSAWLHPPAPPTPPAGITLELMDSYLLAHIIQKSELWGPKPYPTAAELAMRRKGLYAVNPEPESPPGFETADDETLLAKLPLYEGPPLAGTLEASLPVLILHGALDPITPLEGAQSLMEHDTHSNHHLVVIPRGVHGGVTMSADGRASRACADALATGFLADPHSPPARACIEEIPPVDFRGSAELARQFFGTTDLWEGGPASP